ncbi:hypothetical protein N9R86_01440 [Alphaproteobacteria bacterium]|nr:hypothetical protein [Alphaproteobacteria bacterium]
MKFFSIIIIIFTVSNPLMACEDFNKYALIESWLGNNSKFSISYKKGKCALDKALKNMSVEEKLSIVNLISKSYKLESNNKSYTYY